MRLVPLEREDLDRELEELRALYKHRPDPEGDAIRAFLDWAWDTGLHNAEKVVWDRA